MSRRFLFVANTERKVSQALSTEAVHPFMDSDTKEMQGEASQPEMSCSIM